MNIPAYPPVKKNLRFHLLTGVLILVSSFCLPATIVLFHTASAFAQDALTLTAIPPRLGDDLTLTAKPGEKLQTSVRVRNASLQPIQVQSLVQDFVVQDDGETPVPVTEEMSARWSLAKWITLTPSVHSLQPNEIGTLQILIEIPADALPGGHYAMVTHQPIVGGSPGTPDMSTGTGSSLNQRVGTLIYVVVEGTINEEAFIRNLQFPQFLEFGPVPFSFTVDNQSDIHITPQFGVEMYNFWGQKVDTISLPSKNIFPFMNRSFESKWNRVWGIGPYTAKVVMSYGRQGQIVIATTRFWLFPLSLVLTGGVIAMVFLVIGIALLRHLDYRRNENRRKVRMLEQRLAEIKREQTTDLKKREP